jgi:hypothetical protein
MKANRMKEILVAQTPALAQPVFDAIGKINPKFLDSNSSTHAVRQRCTIKICLLSTGVKLLARQLQLPDATQYIPQSIMVPVSITNIPDDAPTIMRLPHLFASHQKYTSNSSPQRPKTEVQQDACALQLMQPKAFNSM